MAGTARRKLASFLQRLGSDGDTIQDDASCASAGEEEDDLSTDGSTTLAELLAAAEGKSTAPFQETANLQRGQGVRKPTFSRLNELEEQVAKLERERVQEAVQHQAQLQQKDRQLLAMQQQLQGELQRMQERQQSLERRAPALRAQLREAKQQLEELPKLEARQYQRLKELPLEARTLKQDVQVVLHEALSELSARVQQQSLELEAAREREQALRRQAEAAGREAARLQRLADATSEDAGAETAGLRSRVERLQSDLEVATIRSEVLAAKGQMFDDVQAKADKLQEEVERLGGKVVGKSALEEELRRLREDFRSRDHECQLLAMDKAYLQKETEALRSDMERLSSQLDVQSKKVSELKEARQVLYEKLHAADSSVRTSSEARLESELGRIKKLAEDDLERMRREHAETLDRETSVLREMRAEAQAECRRLQGQLKDLQATYDDLLVSSREAGRRADLRTTELAGELKLKAFELSRVQCALDEKEAALAQARLQADMLQDKVRVLSDSFYAAEAQHSGRIAELEGQLTASASTLGHYQELERNLDEAILNWSSDQDTREARLLRDLGDAVPTAIRRRVQQSLALAARCSRLEAERQLLAREKEEALSRCAALQGELAVGGQRLMQSQQPHSFLLEELEAAEQRAKRAEASAEALQASLDTKQKELTRAKQVAEEMKADMQQLLSQHASLDSIRRMLGRAAAPALPRVPPSVPQPDATSLSPVIISGSS